MKSKPIWSIFLIVGLLVTAIAPMASAQDTEAQREEILKIAINGPIQDPTNMNMTNWSANRANTGLHQVAYEYFFYSNLQTGEFIPWLATGYEYNADSSALTVTLRDGVTWNDGQPFTSADVVFTYDIMRENPSMSWATEASAAVASVEAVDPLTVTFNLTTPNPRFHLYREGFPAVGIWGGITILPEAHLGERRSPHLQEQSARHHRALPPEGSHPVGRRLGAPRRLVGHRSLWRHPWRRVKSSSSTSAPRRTSPSPSSTTSSTRPTSASSRPAPSRRSLAATRTSAPGRPTRRSPGPILAPVRSMVHNAIACRSIQPEARQAISHLIDRQSIVDLAYEGSTVPAWGIWPEYEANAPFFEAIGDVREQYPIETFDPDLAAELFAQAGVNPEDLNLRLVVNADSNEDMKSTTVIADQLTAAGIEVEVQPLSGTADQEARRLGDYDLAIQAFCPGYIVENLDLFHSKNYVPVGEMAPWMERDSFRYQNPALDAIIDQMFQVDPADTAALTPLFHDAMEIWMADLPVIPIVQAPALVPFNSTYWTGWPTADDPWNMPVSWWATFNLVINGYESPTTGEWVGGIKPAGSQ